MDLADRIKRWRGEEGGKETEDHLVLLAVAENRLRELERRKRPPLSLTEGEQDEAFARYQEESASERSRADKYRQEAVQLKDLVGRLQKTIREMPIVLDDETARRIIYDDPPPDTPAAREKAPSSRYASCKCGSSRSDQDYELVIGCLHCGNVIGPAR